MKRLSFPFCSSLFLVASNQTVVGQTSTPTLEVARVVGIVDGDNIDVDLNNYVSAYATLVSTHQKSTRVVAVL